MEKTDTRRRSAIFLAPATAILLFASGLVQARTPDSAKADQTFMKEAIQGDLAEIQIGKLAQQRGASEGVKQFGERLEADHSANLQKAKPLAKSLGLVPPTSPNVSQKATYDKLSSLSGKEFDRTFAKRMVKDHDKDIREFQRKSRRSGPAADFAKRTLPTLEEHLKLAKSLSGSRT